MLMFICGVSAEDAFEMLRWESQHRNVKLRLLAEQICKDLEELSKSQSTGRRLSSNSVLIAAHQRVVDAAHRLKVDRPPTDEWTWRTRVCLKRVERSRLRALL